MLKQIKLVMCDIENQQFLGTLIEVDEAYIGDKNNCQSKGSL